MKTNEFLCGVIEGYYGRPWSPNQRKSLFEYCLRFGLNTYVYAPKDDAKHRSRWRDLYSTEESAELSQLIHTAKRLEIKFVYALSPGLDLTYSSQKDILALKRKFDQLASFGCEHWALLFDDIESEMCQQDKDRFGSFAHAQVTVANELYDYLDKPNILLFCPTQYCSRMAKPSLDKSLYLQTLGNGLHPDIDILWTGPKVVSRRITVEHILSVNSVLQRRVTIWDNLNANDYDQRRLCLGPFSGRSCELASRISGMLTNPNCEFELNFVPIHTLGQWFTSTLRNRSGNQIDDDEEEEDDQPMEPYTASKALDQALVDWLPELNKVKAANDSQSLKIDSSPQEMSPKPPPSSVTIDEDSQDSIGESQNSTASSKVLVMDYDGSGTSNEITLEDLRFLVELFYLPYEHGPSTQQMIIDFHWLRFHHGRIDKLDEWNSRAALFQSRQKSLARLLQRLTTIHNRSLLYDIYHYINDINSTISLCARYLKWLDDDETHTSVFMAGDPEPWSRRGGLAGDFLNLLPLGDFQSLIKPEPSVSPNIFTIRPMTNGDHPAVCALCTTVCYFEEIDHLLTQHSNILVDKMIGAYLLSTVNNSDLCFAVDNFEDNLCAFVLTIVESEKHDQFVQPSWSEQLHNKYPNVNQSLFEAVHCPQWIYDRYPVRVQFFIDTTIKNDTAFYIGNKLMKLIVENLTQRGCHGCHAVLDERNSLLHQQYLRLGFVDVPNIDQNHEMILVGKQF